MIVKVLIENTEGEGLGAEHVLISLSMSRLV